MPFSAYVCSNPNTLERIQRHHHDTDGPSSVRLHRDGLLVACPPSTRWIETRPGRGPVRTWMALDGYITGMPGEQSSIELEQWLRSPCGAGLDDLGGRHALLAGRFNAGRPIVHARRDPLGGRTAYWAHVGDLFAISSSAYSLATLPEVGLDEDPAWISHHFSLRQERLPGRSAYQNVRELRPGEHLIFDGETARIHRVPIPPPDPLPNDPVDLVERFGAVFERAVRESVGNPQRVAVMLSGGLDSGPVAAIAARALRERGASLHAVSWSLESLPEADESDWIRAIANHLDLKLELFPGESRLPFSNLSPATAHSDSPAYNAYRPVLDECYRRAAALGCGIVLNGNGGDLLYPQRQWLPALMIRHGEKGPAARELAGWLRHTPPWRWHRLPALRFLVRNRISRSGPLRRPRAPDWLTAEAGAPLPRPEPWPPETLHHPVPEFAQQVLGTRIGAASAYENGFASAHGIERREPFAHPDLGRLMLSLPPAMTFHGDTTKWIMRDYALGAALLPEAVCAKPRSGFLHRYFETGFKRHRDDIRALLSGHTEWKRWVNPAVIDRALDASELDPIEALVTAAAVGYQLWRAKIGR